MTARSQSSDSLAASALTRLRDLTPDALAAEWRRLHRGEPPAALRGELLVRALAYTLQARAHGDLSAAAKHRLRVVAREEARDRHGLLPKGSADPPSAPSCVSPSVRTLPPGTRLVREWRGVTHEVIVIPGGFLHAGETHASLSAVARRITGTPWNGWVFFGVERRAREKAEKAKPVAAVSDSHGAMEAARA